MPPTSFITLDDDFKGFSTDEHPVTVGRKPYIDHVLVSAEQIRQRIYHLSKAIVEDMTSKGITSLTFACVLKGGFKFAADLLERMEKTIRETNSNLTVYLDFVICSTYVNDSIGHDTRITLCSDPAKYRGKDILIVEDLVDSGTTLSRLTTYLKSLEPSSIQVAALLHKRVSKNPVFEADYLGFSVPNRFVVGYAIDYNDNFRELAHICVVNEAGKKHYAVPK